MKIPTVLLSAICVAALAGSVGAQQSWRGAPQGHFPGGPPRGPAPAHTAPPAAGRQPPPRAQSGEWRGKPPAGEWQRPHVDQGARWVGHESGRRDLHYRIDRPWAHGHFRHPIGRGHVYRLGGWDAGRRRLWFEHSFFIVAEPDWAYVADWDWNTDEVVLYTDPDHVGWYLAYNVRLGTYVHVQYDGAM